MTQLTPSTSAQSLEARHKLWQMIKDMEIAMLTTVAENGCLHSRPMATQQVDVDRGELWFFTSIDSPKIAEIYHEREVGLAYASPETHRYVSVSGRAFVVRDAEKANELWSTEALTWFPQGVNDPHLSLLRIEAESAQLWDSPGATVVHLGNLLELRLPRAATQNLGGGQKVDLR